MKVWARFKRFWHCLLRFHRACDVESVTGATIEFWCECGKLFWQLDQAEGSVNRYMKEMLQMPRKTFEALLTQKPLPPERGRMPDLRLSGGNYADEFKLRPEIWGRARETGRRENMKADKWGHVTRMSMDSSVFDEICVNCGATDARNDESLNRPCTKPQEVSLEALPADPTAYVLTQEELTQPERKALEDLKQYGPAEDCRQGNDTVKTYIELEKRGLVKRREDETWITDAGKKALKGGK